VERLARNPHDLRFPAEAAELGASRGVEMIDDAIAAVLERGERGLLGEMVDVADAAARVDERRAANHFLRGELERNVEDLVLALVAQLAKEPEVVLDMLEHVDRHDDVEMRAVVVEQVREAEGEPLACLA